MSTRLTSMRTLWWTLACVCKRCSNVSVACKQLECFRCYNSYTWARERVSTWIISTGWVHDEQYPKVRLNACLSLFPTSLAVTKGILVSFDYCAALTDMFKLGAYPHSSWCAFYNGGSWDHVQYGLPQTCLNGFCNSIYVFNLQYEWAYDLIAIRIVTNATH